MRSKIRDFLARDFQGKDIINFLLYGVILVMPFIVVKSYTPKYVVGKAIFLYVVGAMLLLILLKDKLIKIRELYLEDKIIFLFFFALIVSTFSNVAIKTAIVGNDERYEGLLMYFIYLLLFITASRFIKINKKTINITLTVASIMGVYSIFQFYGIDPVYHWATGNEGVIGAFGFIGNRNFFGTYALIFLSLAVGVYIFTNTKRTIIYIAVLFAALLVAQTRGTWIGIFAVMLFIIPMIWKEKKLIFKFATVLLVFLVVYGALNLTSNKAIANRGKTLVSDVKNITSEKIEDKKKAGSGRIGIWIMTMKSIKENPFIGSGPDTLHHRINKYCEEEYDSFIEKNGYYIDKAHNEFLEYLACGGILTLLAYLALVTVILLNLLKRIYESKAKVLFFIIVGYLVQSFFNISVIQVAPIYWIVLGVAVNYYKAKDNERNIFIS